MMNNQVQKLEIGTLKGMWLHLVEYTHWDIYVLMVGAFADRVSEAKVGQHVMHLRQCSQRAQNRECCKEDIPNCQRQL